LGVRRLGTHYRTVSVIHRSAAAALGVVWRLYFSRNTSVLSAIEMFHDTALYKFNIHIHIGWQLDEGKSANTNLPGNNLGSCTLSTLPSTRWGIISSNPSTLPSTWWGIISSNPGTKWQRFDTVLFFSTRISTVKHEIMLHALPLNLTTSITAFTM